MYGTRQIFAAGELPGPWLTFLIQAPALRLSFLMLSKSQGSADSVARTIIGKERPYEGILKIEEGDYGDMLGQVIIFKDGSESLIHPAKQHWSRWRRHG
jgi:hypothetical protein